MRRAILYLTAFIAIVFFIDGIRAIFEISELGRQRIESRNNNQVRKNSTISDPAVTVPAVVNTLIIGYDEEGVRSDVILLLNFSPVKGKLNILSIARDTRIYSAGKPEKINALTAIGGERLLIKQVESMTGLPVHYFFTLNFKGFRQAIDALGGVVYNVPFNMDYDDPLQNLHVHLKAGYQTLNGKKAEQLVRYRKGNEYGQGYTDGDLGRIKAQQEFVKALINQKVKMKYLSKIPDIFSILKKNMNTSIETADINYYLKYVRNIGYDDIKAYTIPGDSKYMEDLWYFVYDRKATKKLIRDNFFM
ncbi:MAG: LCP family protein [Bacillota bacterium]|nr:LCP family protein [Bacillota bacterium]